MTNSNDDLAVRAAMVLLFRKFLSSVLMMTVSVVVALFLGEVIMRANGEDKHYVWPPNLKIVFRPTPETMPGISGDSQFVTNESGMRGKSLHGNYDYRILTIGGSTTECLYLDQSETWPQLVADRLSSDTDLSVWVGNVGRSGRTTRAHVLQVEKLLDQYPQIDLVVLLIGINDLSLRLRRDVEWRPLQSEDPAYQSRMLGRAFSIFPLHWSDPFYYEHTEIWRLLRQAKSKFAKSHDGFRIEDEIGSVYDIRRERRRRAANEVNSLPDLNSALQEYATNVSHIVDLAQERRTKLVFMTQPSIWRTDLPESVKSLLWYGGIGDFGDVKEKVRLPYYSVEALALAMEKYNETLLGVCEARSLNCLDLAQLVPKDTSAFYDDVHFNERGAEIVAKALSGYLLEMESI